MSLKKKLLKCNCNKEEIEKLLNKSSNNKYDVSIGEISTCREFVVTDNNNDDNELFTFVLDEYNNVVDVDLIDDTLIDSQYEDEEEIEIKIYVVKWIPNYPLYYKQHLKTHVLDVFFSEEKAREYMKSRKEENVFIETLVSTDKSFYKHLFK